MNEQEEQILTEYGKAMQKLHEEIIEQIFQVLDEIPSPDESAQGENSNERRE